MKLSNTVTKSGGVLVVLAMFVFLFLISSQNVLASTYTYNDDLNGAYSDDCNEPIVQFPGGYPYYYTCNYAFDPDFSGTVYQIDAYVLRRNPNGTPFYLYVNSAPNLWSFGTQVARSDNFINDNADDSTFVLESFYFPDGILIEDGVYYSFFVGNEDITDPSSRIAIGSGTGSTNFQYCAFPADDLGPCVSGGGFGILSKPYLVLHTDLPPPPASPHNVFSDNFDSYLNGSNLIGQGGWTGLGIINVGNAWSVSSPNSVYNPSASANHFTSPVFTGITKGYVSFPFQIISGYDGGGDTAFYDFDAIENQLLQFVYMDGQTKFKIMGTTGVSGFTTTLYAGLDFNTVYNFVLDFDTPLDQYRLSLDGGATFTPWVDMNSPASFTGFQFSRQNVNNAIVFDDFNVFDIAFGSDVPLPVCTTDCFSNVLFLPGHMGSRLYEKEGTGSTYCGFSISGSDCYGDKELWVSTNDSNHEKLSLDTNGKEIQDTNGNIINDVYTVNDTKKLDNDGDETGIVDDVFSANIYQSFLYDLKELKATDKITDYDFIPYDWRLSLEDVIANGEVDENNHLYYKDNTQDFSESFILKKLKDLQESSKTGKVTIIAHSNGGLVTKALIQKLKDTNNPLYDKIDKIIFVAVPQVGAPEAFMALLHGVKLGYGFVMSAERSRVLSENMPSVYNLLPSASYFTMPQMPFTPEPLIIFSNTPLFAEQIAEYGASIDNEQELHDYILGTDGRIKPVESDLSHPNIGNPILYNQAQSVHQTLDNWNPSPETQVIEVAGWGEETKSNIEYKEYKTFLGNNKISYKVNTTIDGDGTVVVPSALWMPVNEKTERWWVNLKEYNKRQNLNIPRDHKDILEIQSLRNLILSKVKNEPAFSNNKNYLVNNDSVLISDPTDTRFHFTLHSPLSLGITDTLGHYTGLDPVTGEVKEEIPDARYEQIGEVQFLSVPADTAYTLKLQGLDSGDFSLDIDKQLGNIITESTSFQGIPASTATKVTIDISPDIAIADVVLQLDQNGDSVTDLNLVARSGEVVLMPAPYVWNGFSQPINDIAHQAGQSLSVFKAGSTVPVKFQLKKIDDSIVQANITPVWLAPQKGSILTSSVDESVYVNTVTSGTTYKWDAESQQYVYNWSTKGLQAGYWYKIYAKLDDGNTYSVTVGLR
ncbi:MAG: PxKF domain-containing protein [bacterium]|nr:PxKF domain-containing protein [bacterium]